MIMEGRMTGHHLSPTIEAMLFEDQDHAQPRLSLENLQNFNSQRNSHRKLRINLRDVVILMRKDIACVVRRVHGIMGWIQLCLKI
jgi:hypothetical protein